MRFFFYAHDGVGLGHTRRNLAIAAGLYELQPEASVLLATSAYEVSCLCGPPNVELLKLPGLQKVSNGRYVARRLNIPAVDIIAMRSAMLTATVQSFRPDIMLVDKHPFGIKGELTDSLLSFKAKGGRAVLGLRDILDDKATVQREWGAYNLKRRIAEYYDKILIYGDRKAFDTVTEYDFPESISSRAQFTGYVINNLDAELKVSMHLPELHVYPRLRPIVLASSGGGEDGFQALETFIKAAPGAAWKGIVVSGPLSPDSERQQLQNLTRKSGVTFHSFLPCLPGQFRLADAIVCRGGYNTLVEAVARGIPTVCVPRVLPRKEQLIRAEAFAKLGLLRIIKPEQLSVDRLRAEIDEVLKLRRGYLEEKAKSVLNFDGARQAAQLLIELARCAQQQNNAPKMTRTERVCV